MGIVKTYELKFGSSLQQLHLLVGTSLNFARKTFVEILLSKCRAEAVHEKKNAEYAIFQLIFKGFHFADKNPSPLCLAIVWYTDVLFVRILLS